MWTMFVKRSTGLLGGGLLGGGLLGGALLGAGCSTATVDVADALRVSGVTTGWVEAERDAGSKIVPVVSFRLDNPGPAPLGVLQVNGVFRRAGEDAEWGSVLLRAVGREGLAAGATAGPFTLRSARGYTGRQPGGDLLAHSQFVDVEVELFVRHRAAGWVRLRTLDVDRRLLMPARSG